MTSTDYDGRSVDLVPGSLRGFRKWYLTGMGELRAVWKTYTWRPGPNMAECLSEHDYLTDRLVVKSAHSAPRLRCTCGFYATYTADIRGIDGTILGAIRASGRVVLGTRGFRAEFVAIEALCDLGFSSTEPFRRMEARYGVPVFRDRHEFLEAFPPQDVSELVGKAPERDQWNPPTCGCGNPNCSLPDQSALWDQYKAIWLNNRHGPTVI